jgi:DNA polymerase-3 subunit alpha
MIDQIKAWIEQHNLNVQWLSDTVFSLADKNYLCLDHKNGKVLNNDFTLIINDNEAEEYQSKAVSFLCFVFGGKVYYSKAESEKAELRLLKHIGTANDLSGFPFLGVHGGYELCSGSGIYPDWVKKAKWLGIPALGIAEKHTLAGSIKFQGACKKEGIKSIIGETISIKAGIQDYRVKLYVANYEGWRNLLRIHRNLNIDNSSQFANEEILLKNSAGLYLVFCSDVMLDVDKASAFKNLYDFKGVYFQYDPVEYSNQQRDLHGLNCLKTYLNQFKDTLPLALICDAYYLDKEDSKVKKILNFIGKGDFYYQSDNQHLKSLEEVASQTIDLFTTKGEEFSFDILGAAMEGLNEIVDGCDFQIPLGEIHLPKYEMTAAEKAEHKTSEDLFYAVIQQGLEKKIEEGKDADQYLQRVENELKVILAGGFIDYFLIVRDIINWAELNGIMVGTGRGSIGGSLVAHLMNITKVDALEYGLIFERFLNESRIGKGLPDIDTDFVSHRRDDVIRYMEQRFGSNNVAAIGTFTALKLKAAFRDLLRFHGEQPQNINYFAGFISESGTDFAALFYEASEADKLKDFINERSEAVNEIQLILGQPKSASVHASGVIITPKHNKKGEPMEIYDWMPCKRVVIKNSLGEESFVIITEWEGVPLDDAGFLKADILGLNQLDKLQAMIDLIKERTDDLIDLNKIDRKDKKVFSLFEKGLNQDVFQFGTDGLSAYCREVKPVSVDELAIINALYRPGAMDSGAHTDYVKIKFGKKEPEYDFGCEEITKSTNSLLVFQEQAIKIVQVVGGFSLTDGDGVRKATGKKDLDKMKSYKDKFVAGAVRNGCPEHEAHKIWDKIEVFAGYSFNLSHAVAYSLIGYQTQWLKQHFPLEFWTISLQFAGDDEVPKRISELNKFEGIKLYAPEINKSRSTFYTDWDKNSIYWSLSRISHVGEKALAAIIHDREVGGSYFSLEEFVKRVRGKEANSRVVKHLILSGCFDEIHQIEFTPKRLKLIEEFCSLYKIDLPLEFQTDDVYKEFFWYKLQRSLSGYGYFNYGQLLTEKGYHFNSYITPDQMQLSDNEGYEGNVCGLIVDVVKRRTKKGEMGKLTLDCNNDLVDVVLWNDQWKSVDSDIEANIGNGLIVSGQVKYDNYNKKNVMYSNEKTTIEIF